MTRTMLSGEPPLPDMTVIELSVIVALLEDGPLRRERIARLIEDWFVRPVRPTELEPCLNRMQARGWVSDEAGTALSPTRAAEAPTMLLYAGAIRMIGAVEGSPRGTGRLRLRGFRTGDE